MHRKTTGKTQAIQKQEPDWLYAYRERNKKIFEEKPIKKSKYTSLSKLEGILEADKTKVGFIPECSGVKILCMSFEESILKMPVKLEEILSSESGPKDQFEAFVNSKFNSGHTIVIGKENNGRTVR